MCENPGQTADGEKFACRKCKQCRQRKINDWVGRNIAETKSGRKSFALTLTYGRNEANEVLHEHAIALTYSDFQKYMKRLRKDKFDVRYFVTGEYGSLRGRAHWHPMLYFKGKVPKHVLDVREMQEHWDHGTSFWTKPGPHAVRYNCKYVLKDMDDAGKQSHLAMSKKPPIGAEYFRQLAENHIREGLAPQTLEYSFPDVRFTKKSGQRERVRFWLQKRSAELYLDHYLEQYWQVPKGQSWLDYVIENRYRPFRNLLPSPLIDEYTDKVLSKTPDVEGDAIELRKIEAAAEKAFEAPIKGPPIRNEYEWFEQWIKEAKDGEERQAREYEFQRYGDELHAWITGDDEKRRAERFPKVDWNFLEQVQWERNFDAGCLTE